MTTPEDPLALPIFDTHDTHADDLRDLLQLASPDGQRALATLRAGLSPDFIRRAARRLDSSCVGAMTTLPSAKETS